MKPRITLIACVLLAQLSMPIAAQDCKDWVPRFELVLHEPERGEFYEGEPIVVEIWVVDVCPEIMPKIDYATFHILRECISWVPDCSGRSRDGVCCRFIDGRRASFCSGSMACDGDHNESVAGSLGEDVEACGKAIAVPSDGRVLLGKADLFGTGSFEVSTVESVTVGDSQSRTGNCSGSQNAVIEWRRPAMDPAPLYPEDSEPVLIRGRRRPFLRGDSNRDGVLDLSDPIHILTVLFLGNPNPFECANASDVDDNNRHEITDAISLLVFLFNGGAPPAPPYPEPGYDQTPTSPEMSIQSGCGLYL